MALKFEFEPGSKIDLLKLILILCKFKGCSIFYKILSYNICFTDNRHRAQNENYQNYHFWVNFEKIFSLF